MTQRVKGVGSWPVRRWIRIGFLVWGVTSTTWLANTMRTRGVAPELLQSRADVSVVESNEAFELVPHRLSGGSGVVFLCGAGVSAHAYVPLLRPIAEAGHPVIIIKLPFRFAPLETHRAEAIARAHRRIAVHDEVSRWIVAGHSLGGALAARMAADAPQSVAGLVLIGTTHPRDRDLSSLPIPVVKIYGTADGVAPLQEIRRNSSLLPPGTRWVEIDGGNHSQFGHYGHQLFDGTPSVTREDQQHIVRRELLDALRNAAGVIR